MLQTKALLTSLLGISEERPRMKSQEAGMRYKEKQGQVKAKKIFDEPKKISDDTRKNVDDKDKKQGKVKEVNHAVSKLLNNIKASKVKQEEENQKPNVMPLAQKQGPRFQPYKPQRAPLTTEPVEVESGPHVDVELLYERDYGDEMEKTLFTNMVTL